MENIDITQISLALLFIIGGLNYLLPPDLVKKLKLDSVQKLLAFLAKTPGGIKTK